MKIRQGGGHVRLQVCKEGRKKAKGGCKLILQMQSLINISKDISAQNNVITNLLWHSHECVNTSTSEIPRI